jgi:hypothetical protein
MENLRKDEKGGRMACQAARAEFPISLVIPGRDFRRAPE